MAEPLKDISNMNVQSQSQPLKFLETVVFGRVSKVSRNNDAYNTLVMSPAPDEYSMPSQIDVQSTERLGNPGDEVKFVALIKGIPNKFTNSKTGEIVHTARHFLNFVRFAR